ncbi:MerR family transcriptional regulator (plasmid) [Coraliomargarita sp. W4R53]
MGVTFSMGEASASTGLSPDALRYYEAEGIIGPFTRDASNRRRVTNNDLAWIGVITCMRDAGLGISDLRIFAELLRESDVSADPTVFLQSRRAALATRADTLARAINVLDEKIAHYSQATTNAQAASD